jgi:MFS family permease
MGSASVLPGSLIVINNEELPGRLYDRTFLIAVLSQMGFVLGNTLMTHYGRWIEYLGGDAAQVGWVMGLGAASAVICRPWLGQLINRLGPRTTWAIGYVLFAIGVVPNMLISDGLLDQGMGISLYLFRACMALGAAFVFTSSLTYVTHLAPRHRRTEVIGILGIAGFVGMMIGPFVGDMLLDRPDRDRGDFAILFLAAGSAVVIPLLLLLFLPRPEKTRVEQSGGLVQFVRLCRRYWPGPVVLVCLAFGFCMTVPFVFLPTFVDQRGITLGSWSTIGVFFWVYSCWGIFLRVVFRRLPERIGRHNVLYAGLTAMVLAMLMYYRIDPERPWTFLLAAWMGGTGHGLLFHTAVSLTIDAFPSEVRGTGTALATMFIDLGMVGGPPVLGIIAKRTGYQEMFLVIGAVVAVIGIFYACWRRFGRHHDRSVSPSNG